MKDFYFIIIIGLLSGLFSLLPAKNIKGELSVLLDLYLVGGFTFLNLFTFFLLKYFSKFWDALDQFSKFASIGLLNALLTASILNLLVFITGIMNGFYFIIFTIIAFLISNINSYFWNKFWTFKSVTKILIGEYAHFAAFTIIGSGIINVGTISFLVNIIKAPEFIDAKIWLNMSIVVAVIFSFIWNFISYKHVVFKSKI